MRLALRATMLLVVSVIACRSGGVQAEEVRWYSSPSAAVAAAADEHRPIVVYVSGSYCSHCRRMDRNTWNDRSVQQTVATGFVPLKLDVERDASVIEQLGIQSVPTTLIVGYDRRVLGAARGYVEPRKLQEWLHRAATELAAE